MKPNDAITPPCSPEAEQSVLGGLMLDAGAVDRLPPDLKAESFYIGSHREIFAAIMRLATVGKPIDALTVFDELGEDADTVGGLAFLSALAANTPSAANIRRYAEVVIERAMLRSVISVGYELAAMGHEAGADARALLESAQTQLSALGIRRNASEPVAFSEAIAQHAQLVQERAEKQPRFSRIPTGFADIDKAFMGGLARGSFALVAGRPSHGKTALAMNIATNVAAKGYGVLVFSLEMTRHDLMDRQVAARASIGLERIIRGDLSDDEWPRLSDVMGCDDPMWIDDTGGMGLFELTTKARRHKRTHGLDLLVIDYLQLISGLPGEKEYDRISRVSVAMKSLAKELDVALVALSQLSRAGAGKSVPSLADLRGSGSLEQDADVVVFVYRDEMDNPDTSFKGVADVTVGKNRQGRTGRIALAYQGEYTRFRDYAGALPNYEAIQARRAGGLR